MYGLQKAQRCPRTSAQSNRKSLLWKGRVFIGAYRMIGKKSLTFELAPFVFDFLRHGERTEVMSVCLVPVKRTSTSRGDRSVFRVICCIFNECFDNNEISLNLVRYISSIFRPLTCSVLIYRYGFGRYPKRVNGRISFGI